MVNVEFDPFFKKKVGKIKDNALREKVKKHISKIVRNPKIGKPMRFTRRGTREVYVHPFRLSYLFSNNADTLVFLDLYHKDEQ